MKTRASIGWRRNRRAGPIGKQTQLLFFDPVLHVTAGTVEIFVQLLGRKVFFGQRGHYESGILSFGELLRLPMTLRTRFQLLSVRYLKSR